MLKTSRFTYGGECFLSEIDVEKINGGFEITYWVRFGVGSQELLTTVVSDKGEVKSRDYNKHCIDRFGMFIINDMVDEVPMSYILDPENQKTTYYNKYRAYELGTMTTKVEFKKVLLNGGGYHE